MIWRGCLLHAFFCSKQTGLLMHHAAAFRRACRSRIHRQARNCRKLRDPHKKAGITNVPSSDVEGHIAVSPIAAAAMTGFDFTLDTGGTFSTSTQLRAGGGFQAFAADYLGNTDALLSSTAVSDMEEAACTDAAGPLTPMPRGSISKEERSAANYGLLLASAPSKQASSLALMSP
jgi:hypothetical protein